MKLILDKFTAYALAFIVTGMLLVSGCASTNSERVLNPEAVAPPVAAPNPRNVEFQSGNLITVTFSDVVTPIPQHEERIKEDGNITLPLIGPVKAAGQTALQLEKAIEEKYVPTYYLRLRATVKYQSTELAYSVLGEVRQPGQRAYYGKTKLTEAIGAGGGLTEFASKSKVYLIRAGGSRTKFSYKKALQDSKFDPEVFPGDSVYVEKSWW